MYPRGGGPAQPIQSPYASQSRSSSSSKSRLSPQQQTYSSLIPQQSSSQPQQQPPTSLSSASGPNYHQPHGYLTQQNQSRSTPLLVASRPSNPSSHHPVQISRPINPNISASSFNSSTHSVNSHGAIVSSSGGGGSNGAGNRISDPRQRRMVADKLIHDCYSKLLVGKDGRKFTDTSYQTHIAISEYSQFPSQPPPPNLPLSKVGSVKNRVLVICVKYSGRVIIQKGKFNDAKNIYQIGRTWDMDELKSIRRIDDSGLLLSLNKDYYWKTDEGMERLWKFARALTSYYGGFMGRYPQLFGFSIIDFKLPQTAVKKSLTGSPQGTNDSTNDIILNEPVPDPALMKTRSLKRQNLPNPLLPVEALPPAPITAPKPSDSNPDFYKDFDFTSNGKLPTKPMKVMSVDRHGSQVSINNDKSTDNFDSPSSNYAKTPHMNLKSNQNTPEGPINEDRGVANRTTPGSNFPYQQKSPLNNMSTASAFSTDTQSFIFEDSQQQPSQYQQPDQHQKSVYSPEKLHEYAKETSNSSPLRNYKPQSSESFSSAKSKEYKDAEPLESVVALGYELQQQLEGSGSATGSAIGSGIGSAKNLPRSDSTSSKTENDFIRNFATSIPESPQKTRVAASAKVPDFGIEEITDDSDTDTINMSTLKKRVSQQESVIKKFEEERDIKNNLDKDVNVEQQHYSKEIQPQPQDHVGSSIQEIENLLDSHLSGHNSNAGDEDKYFNEHRISNRSADYSNNNNNFNNHNNSIGIDQFNNTTVDSFQFDGAESALHSEVDLNEVESNAPSLKNIPEVPLQTQSSTIITTTTPKIITTSDSQTNYSFEDDSMYTNGDTVSSEPGLNIVKKDSETNPQTDKDAELEELFDEVKWTIQDDSEAFIRKLTKELNNVKQQNVKELVSLNFGNSSVSQDVNTSISEVENISHIFKKMEIDFKFLSPEVKAIENNSSGLQVKSINKKILYNDLRGILQKVSINSSDLNIIESFREFDRLSQLESLELALLDLYNALSTIRFDPVDEEYDLSSMRALKQYGATYERVSNNFINNFIHFAKSKLRKVIVQASENFDHFQPQILLKELNGLLIYSGITYFVKEVGGLAFRDLNQYFTSILSDFMESLIKFKLKTIKYSVSTANSSTTSLTSSPTLEDVTTPTTLKKSRTLRLTRKVGRFGSLSAEDADDHRHQSPNLDSIRRFSGRGSSNEIDDPKVVIAIVDEACDLISLVQFFIGTFFHYDKDTTDYDEFIKAEPYSARRKKLDQVPQQKIETLNNEKSYASSDLIGNMTAIFGNFINVFSKKINPMELILPVILIHVENLLHSTQSSNQEFLSFSFLKKMIDKYKTNWDKFIENQIELLNNSIIVAKSGVLPSVKNVNQLLLITESYLENHRDIRNTQVRELVDHSYGQISEALIHLFMRDDPLLKNNDLDDKEREHRNVSIIQNIFFILEQLGSFNSANASTKSMKTSLESVFNKVEATYFQRLLNKNVGKLVEFVNNYEALEKMNNGKPKKYNKKYVKSLLASYTNKEVSLKAQEIFKKLEKHFVTGGDMFEKDLLDKLWFDMETSFVNYFTRLSKILRNDFDRDIEYNVSRQEVHTIFKAIH
ncbi:exocyst complex component Sec3-domain-containing protein [Scheffersomyces xylosifermentans]|uniref:exocyst complex component Sec3-domain-containing protein n=1 Tax=Scheffersomyces xylosifermentans TaxID=1304137 RepID=UPI00315CC9A4